MISSEILPEIFVPFFFVLLIALLLIFVFFTIKTTNLDDRFSYSLSSKVSLAELLQKYSRIYGSLDIKVNANITGPVLYEHGLLYINKNYVYKPNLYVGVIALLEIEKGRRKRNYWYSILMATLMILILIGSVLGILYSYWILGIVDICILLLLFLSFLSYKRKVWEYSEILDIARDLLELNNEESSLATKLLLLLAEREYIFAPNMVVRLLRFFLPL